MDGKVSVDVLDENHVFPGIKVDMGTVEIAGTNAETTTLVFKLYLYCLWLLVSLD